MTQIIDLKRGMPIRYWHDGKTYNVVDIYPHGADVKKAIIVATQPEERYWFLFNVAVANGEFDLTRRDKLVRQESIATSVVRKQNENKTLAEHGWSLRKKREIKAERMAATFQREGVNA